MAVAADFHRDFLIPERTGCARQRRIAADDLCLFFCGDSVPQSDRVCKHFLPPKQVSKQKKQAIRQVVWISR